MTKVKRNFKSSLFANLFGKLEHKEHLLLLCNALNGTNYPLDTKVEINTIEGAIIVGIQNDVSCIIDNYMNLIEHQSTINPNMPLRGMLYCSKLYDKFVEENNHFIYGTRLVEIPTPRYYVLYNGNDKYPDCKVLKLSDAFVHKEGNNGYEWTATVLNINVGHNEKLMKACSMLRDYALFVAKVKDNRAQNMSIKDAVMKAVEDCINEGILADYLRKNKAEVDELILSCTFEEAMAYEKRDHEAEMAKKDQKIAEAEAKAAEAIAEATNAKAELSKVNAQMEELMAKMNEMQKQLDAATKNNK